MALIDLFRARSGRLVKEDGTTVNIADDGMKISGRNSALTKTVLTTTPLGAGAQFTSSTRDLTTTGMNAVGLYVVADTFTTIAIQGDGGSDAPATSQWKEFARVAFAPGTNEFALFLPLFKPQLPRFRWVIVNPTAGAQTSLYVAEVASPVEWLQPHNIKSWIAYQLPIRDTSSHTYATDAASVANFKRLPWGGAKLPIFVNNTHDQAVTMNITMIAAPAGGSIGTKSIAAGTAAVITNSDFAALDVPSEEVRISFSCAVAPTTGYINAIVDSVMGGSA